MNETEINERWETDIFRLDIIRKAKGITHQHIGELLGMQQSNISKFFSASNRPSYELMKNIANTLGINIGIFDPSNKINMDAINIEASERLEAFINSSVEDKTVELSQAKDWWKKHSERKQRKLLKEYFFPADAMNIDPEFGITNEELIEIYERNQVFVLES